MLFTSLGRSVFGKTVPEVLSTALGLRPRALLRASREEATFKSACLAFGQCFQGSDKRDRRKFNCEEHNRCYRVWRKTFQYTDMNFLLL